MVFLNYSTMQMVAKIVFYGPGLCGKTTNLKEIYKKTSPKSRGEMVSLETETDRTLFFDLLPMDVGVVGGFKTKFQLYTVPGQVFYNSTRKLVLRGVDGIVFVADSQKPMFDANVDSFENLQENLAEMGLDLNDIPLVYQYNKRDLPNISTVEELNEGLNPYGRPYVQAAALQGIGVFETLKEVSKQTLLKLRDKASGNEPPKKEKPTLQVRGNDSHKDTPREDMPKNVSFDTYPGTNDEVQPTSVPAPTPDPDANPEKEGLPDVSMHNGEVLKPDQDGQIGGYRENTLDNFDLDFSEDDSLAGESLDLDDFNDLDIEDSGVIETDNSLDESNPLETSGASMDEEAPLVVDQEAEEPLNLGEENGQHDMVAEEPILAEPELSESPLDEPDLVGPDQNDTALSEAVTTPLDEDVAPAMQDADALVLSEGDDDFDLTPDESPEDEFGFQAAMAEAQGYVSPPEDDSELTFDEGVLEEEGVPADPFAEAPAIEMDVDLGARPMPAIAPDSFGDTHDSMNADLDPVPVPPQEDMELDDQPVEFEETNPGQNEIVAPPEPVAEDLAPTTPDAVMVEEPPIVEEAPPVETAAADDVITQEVPAAEEFPTSVEVAETSPEPALEPEPAQEPTTPEAESPVAAPPIAAPPEPAPPVAATPEPAPPVAPAPEPPKPEVKTKTKKKSKSLGLGLDDLDTLTTSSRRTRGKSKRSSSVDNLFGDLGTASTPKKKAKLEKFTVKVPQGFANAQLNCVFVDDDENVIHTELLKVHAQEVEEGHFQIRLTLDIERDA
ncbi:GTPase domain-containing protein [Sulfidibacter corallicola]|uniref:Mutual gliding-motility protein MglA n=1 Tax=Sulfidibacter corallicola TaxID=2818388 RepID=A0A8A4TUL7_SULCO|nr:GTPase domain-containing protein [Sulfidibacter corallicola]QTD52722.1 hypothetical protein J3U87_09620 [Sulfidibacter corallicola]